MNTYRTRIGIILTVTVAEFYNSATHIFATAHAAGNSVAGSATYPVVVDGMVLAAVLTLITPKGVNRMARFYAGWARVVGYAATLYCNVAASGFHNLNSGIVFLFPGVGLILVLEIAVYSLQQTPAAKRGARVQAPAKLRRIA